VDRLVVGGSGERPPHGIGHEGTERGQKEGQRGQDLVQRGLRGQRIAGWGVRVGAPKPAAIFGIPVGFVGAVESKEALVANARGVPFLIVRGRTGGSAMTAAAVNALARPGL